jgi:hypothetical protein
MRFFKLTNIDLPCRKYTDVLLKGTIIEIDYKKQIMYYGRTGPLIPEVILFYSNSLIINKIVNNKIRNSPLDGFLFYNFIVKKIVRMDWFNYSSCDDFKIKPRMDNPNNFILDGVNDNSLLNESKELYMINSNILGEYDNLENTLHLEHNSFSHFFKPYNNPSTTIVSEKLKCWLEENYFDKYLHFIEIQTVKQGVQRA